MPPQEEERIPVLGVAWLPMLAFAWAMALVAYVVYRASAWLRALWGARDW